MCSPLEISFQPQTFQTFLFPGRSDQGILIHCPVVDPSFVLNMGLCLDIAAVLAFMEGAGDGRRLRGRGFASNGKGAR